MIIYINNNNNNYYYYYYYNYNYNYYNYYVKCRLFLGIPFSILSKSVLQARPSLLQSVTIGTLCTHSRREHSFFLSAIISPIVLQLDNGEATAKGTTDAIKRLPGDIWFPESGRLLVEATVVEKATGVREKTVDNAAVFTSTPYNIKYKNTAEYFKPGLPFTVKVSLSVSLGLLSLLLPLSLLLS